jgi:hypothetical protein
MMLQTEEAEKSKQKLACWLAVKRMEGRTSLHQGIERKAVLLK